jgi:hypothetical protein
MSRILARFAACCIKLSWPPMVERGVRMGVANLQQHTQQQVAGMQQSASR